jgi:hypothetical protein
MRNFGLFILFLSIVLAFSCKKGEEITSFEEELVLPERNLSYSRHIQPLFDRKCAISGCHDDRTKASNLSLTSYENATARPGIIIPKDPENSVLVMRIEGRLQPRMPLGMAPLTQNQINGIKQWIREGALNN